MVASDIAAAAGLFPSSSVSEMKGSPKIPARDERAKLLSPWRCVHSNQGIRRVWVKYTCDANNVKNSYLEATIG